MAECQNCWEKCSQYCRIYCYFCYQKDIGSQTEDEGRIDFDRQVKSLPTVIEVRTEKSILDSKNEKSVLGSKTEKSVLGSKNEKNVLPKPEQVSKMSLSQIDISVKDTVNIYALATSIMQNYVGKPTYPYLAEPKELYPYILHLCDLNECTKMETYAAKEINNMELTIIIREATIVHPTFKDFTNVYCKIWTAGDDTVKFTSVRNSSNMLLWDEGFVLDLKNYASKTLHIEVWSSLPKNPKKETSTSKSEINVNEKEYLIGDIVEEIRNLPCIGQDVVWALKKGHRRIYTRGQLKFFIQLNAKPDTDHIFHIYMYMELMTKAYEKNLEYLEHTTLWKNWLEILPNAALTLIQQHAIQSGIRPTEQCICSWLLASALQMKGEDRIGFYLLQVLLEGLLTDIAEDPVADYLENALLNSISMFSAHVLKILEHLHDSFNVENTDSADELFYLLRCMNCTELENKTSYLNSYPIIAKEAYSWYLRVIAENRKDLEEEDQNVERVTNCLKDILKAYLKNQIILDDIFTRAWTVSYTKITYNALDQLVAEIIKPIIIHIDYVIQNPERNREVNESLKKLQLYHNVRNLVNYVTNDLPKSRGELCMDEYSDWFGEDIILEWFLLWDTYSQPFIKRAIAMDKMERLNEDITHGTSVSDVASIIDEIVVDVWMKLKWEDQFHTHKALREAIKTCGISYVNEMSKIIEEKKFFCDEKKFTIGEKLCVALSNVYAMFEHLHTTEGKIKVILNNTKTEYGFSIEDSEATIESQMQIAVANIFHKVLKKLSSRFRVYVKRMIHTRRTKFQSTTVADTCIYIESSLETMYLNWKPELFYIVLRHMWIVVIVNISEDLKVGPDSFLWWNKKYTYSLILQALGQLKAIFYCDGHGLSHAEMQNKLYLEIQKKIEKQVKPAH